MARQKSAFLPKIPKIPEKQFFRIGEVSDLTGIKPHVLRYWETEFPVLSPRKSGSNQRLYKKQDIELVFLLKKLLYHDGFTINGARARLRNRSQSIQELWHGGKTQSKEHTGSAPSTTLREGELNRVLCEVRKELVTLRSMLASQTHPHGNSPSGSA